MENELHATAKVFDALSLRCVYRVAEQFTPMFIARVLVFILSVFCDISTCFFRIYVYGVSENEHC